MIHHKNFGVYAKAFIMYVLLAYATFFFIGMQYLINKNLGLDVFWISWFSIAYGLILSQLCDYTHKIMKKGLK